MSQPETSYFNLRPCDKEIGTTDPKPEPHKHISSLAMDNSYLHDLNVTSLPPLSHLLTTDGDNKNATSVPASSHQGNTITTTNSTHSSPVSATASPTTSVVQALVNQEQQERQLFGTTNTTTSPIHTSLATSSSLSAVAAISAMTGSMEMIAPSPMQQTPVTTSPMTMLMDPTSAAAAAMYLPPSDSTTTTTSSNATAVAAATAAASLMTANNSMLSTGNPSSFYNMPPASTSASPINNDPTNTDLASSFMMLPNNNIDSHDAIEKNYSFVSIPGANQRKRPRRRYDEIERLYHCTWPGCTKSYGTLNHLNAHVSMQKHGEKRHPSEFKEMRRTWRRQKKEREGAKKAAEKENLNSSSMANAAVAAAAMMTVPGGPMIPSLQSYNTYTPFPSMYTSFSQNMASISAYY
ncbi:unnamed protein product [Absidia cylindrospora]